MTIRSFIAAVLLTPLAALAQTTPAEPAPAAPAATLESAKPSPWYSTVTFGGAVDAYYMVRFDAAQDTVTSFRAFDAATGFNLGYAKLTAAMAPSPAGFRLDLGFGPSADVVTPGTTAKYVQQAYVALQLGPVELDVGRFVTSAGAELIEAKDNWIYSRSLLFNLIPFTHVGAKATATLIPGLTATLGVNNGWDVIGGGQPAKTGQLSLAYAGPSSSLVAVNLYEGINPTTYTNATNTTFYRTLVDIVAGASFGPLDVNANFDWSTEAADSWYGGALMARYHLLGDIARVSVRGEIVKDLNGVRFGTGTDTTVVEGTLSAALPVATNAELRAEVRYDHADEDIFQKGVLPSNHQVTGTVAALAWF
jgi:hypothetical protein